MYIYIYIYMYVCVCIYMYIYIYIHIYTYIHIYFELTSVRELTVLAEWVSTTGLTNRVPQNSWKKLVLTILVLLVLL